MRGTVLYGPGDIRFEDREDPKIMEPTDALIRMAATCVCGSDLWPYRGLQPINGPTPMGHEYCGFVEEVGSAVKSVKPGQFVVGSFATSDNVCPHCRNGYQSLADGTLVPTGERGNSINADIQRQQDGCAGPGQVRAGNPGRTMETPRSEAARPEHRDARRPDSRVTRPSRWRRI